MSGLIRIDRHDCGEEGWSDRLAAIPELRSLVPARPDAPLQLARLRCEEVSIASVLTDPAETGPALEHAAAGFGAAGLVQERANAGRQGTVLLREPTGDLVEAPVGNGRLYAPEWLTGVSVALTARSRQALAVLCTPRCVDACIERGPELDPFWPLLCGAVAAVTVEPDAAAGLCDAAEQSIPSDPIADPAVIELRIRPLIELVRALGSRDEGRFDTALGSALTAHKELASSADFRADPHYFLAYWVMGIWSLAHDRGLEPEIESEYAPPPLVRSQGTTPESVLAFRYSLRSVKSLREAHWFLDLEGFPAEPRSESILDREGRLVTRFEAIDGPGLPRALVDFIVLDGSGGADPLSVEPALDPGELLELAKRFADASERTQDASHERRLLEAAIDCVDEVIARIPTGRDSIEPDQLTSRRGSDMHHADPGAFRREQLSAYRKGLEGFLSESG